MTPGAPIQEFDGPAKSLYERFLWRLFSKDYTLYERYQPFFSDKSKVAEALKAVNRPVLIIVDEILDYVGNGLDGANKPELAAQDMAFLRALFDVVNDVPHVALLAVMIASDRDTTSLSPAAKERRDDLNALLERNGTPPRSPRSATSPTSFAGGSSTGSLRPRSWPRPPRSTSRSISDPAWTKNVWDQIGASWRDDWQSRSPSATRSTRT